MHRRPRRCRHCSLSHRAPWATPEETQWVEKMRQDLHNSLNNNMVINSASARVVIPAPIHQLVVVWQFDANMILKIREREVLPTRMSICFISYLDVNCEWCKRAAEKFKLQIRRCTRAGPKRYATPFRSLLQYDNPISEMPHRQQHCSIFLGSAGALSHLINCCMYGNLLNTDIGDIYEC